MKTLQILSSTAIAVVLTALMTSCEHKELCYRHPHTADLEVVFDWSDAPDANPGSMCVYFYSEDSEAEPYVFHIVGNHGASISLPEGSYSVVTYNTDTDGVSYGDTDSFDSHHLYTREGSVTETALLAQSSGGNVPRPAESADQRVVITPDQMWGYSTTGISVKRDLGKTQTITLYPHLLTCNYTYEIRNVKNLKYVSRMSAALSGMSGKLHVSSERNDPEAVTLALASSWDSSTIYGQFFTFGYSDETDVSKQLMLYVWSVDGAKYSYGTSGEDNYNVSQQILNAPDKRNVHIIIEKGPVLHEADEDGNGGYTITVDDWNEEDSSIYL